MQRPLAALLLLAIAAGGVSPVTTGMSAVVAGAHACCSRVTDAADDGGAMRPPG